MENVIIFFNRKGMQINTHKQIIMTNQVVELGGAAALTMGQGGSMNECRVYPQTRVLFIT